jgi:aryl-alcohol dehydrogenase-like predicted oxidoreductase
MSALALPPKTRPLGASGIEVSSLAWGMWRFAGDDLKASRAKVDAAFEAGITLFDTADIYGPDNGEPFGASEALLGRLFAEDGSLRDRMVLASKGGIVIGTPYDSSPAYIASAINASLKRLGTDRLDLWQIHRPDILTHPQEVARALDDAVTAGKVRAVGVSNYTAAQVAALSRFLTVPLASLQPEFSALALGPLEDRIMDTAMGNGMAVLAWSPLGQGRIGVPNDERSRRVAAALDVVAERAGVSRTAAAYSWVMAHPAHPIPIVGTQNPARIRAAADAWKVSWTRKDWYAVLVASMGENLP